MRLQKFISQDFSWKLLSVVLAAVIWGAVNKITRDRSVVIESPLSPWESVTLTNLPVLVVSAAADVREFRVSPNTVAVTVSGRPENLATLQDKDIEARVDLTDVESARNLRKRVVISTPPGVAFVRVQPPDVEVVVPPKKK